MKKYLIIPILALALSACTDYLNVKPRGYDVASRIDHYEGLLYGTDRSLMNISFPYMMSAFCFTYAFILSSKAE